ncbi:MAG: glucose-6-phosphate dehydrogenase [Gammaproteobacteria bacterium WSBS_2016_MAG_OTU1]
MTTRIIPVNPFTITVIGASGDLARRKIYPALWWRRVAGQAPAESRIIGIARQPMSDDDFRAFVHQSLIEFGGLKKDSPDALLDEFLASLSYFQLDAGKDENWAQYMDALQDKPRPHLFYFSVAPELAEEVCLRLQTCGALDGDGRLILEKPFGRDFASARALNEMIKQAVKERNIYRIDHYLGKETVQNLMALRFANTLLEPIWNAHMIDHVQITVAEDLGVGGRGGYYDNSGVARDMLQNHLLQLLCLITMEPPASYLADNVRDEKLKVLNSLRPFTDKTLAQQVVCGQYTAANGNPSYLQDISAKHSATSTYVAVKCAIDNWRWASVPFYLRTGKRLHTRVSEIAIHFRHAPHSIFPNVEKLPHNVLVIRLQPSESITLHINIKDPGPGGFRLTTVPLDMSFADSLDASLPDAYERLLMDVVRGDQTLFMRSDELELAWLWIEPLIKHIENTTPDPYMCGSSGPDDAMRLMYADGRKWREIV